MTKETINDFFSGPCFRKDIVAWKYKKGLLTLEVDSDIFDTLFDMAEVNDIDGDKSWSDRITNRENERRILESQLRNIEQGKSVNTDVTQDRNTVLTLDNPLKLSAPNLLKPSSDCALKGAKSKRAFVKAYFLYEFLIETVHLNGEFSCEHFFKSLRAGKEVVATDSEVGTKIMERLYKYRILYINKQDHLKSLKSDYKARYKYVFHELDRTRPIRRRNTKQKTTTLSYHLHSSIANKITFRGAISWYMNN